MGAGSRSQGTGAVSREYKEKEAKNTELGTWSKEYRNNEQGERSRELSSEILLCSTFMHFTSRLIHLFGPFKALILA